MSAVLTQSSDGKTPEETTQQILSIAPIIPGQKPTEESALSENQPQQASQPTQSSGNTNDLIDFGGSHAPAAAAGTQEKKSALDDMNDLAEPLNPVRRQNSLDGGDEEFVDAES